MLPLPEAVKDPVVVPARGCNARTGVIHRDWRIRAAIIGSNTDRQVGEIGGPPVRHS